MEYELTAIVLAARSVLIRFIEGEYHVFISEHSGVEHHVQGKDLPWLIHQVFDEIMF
jgi:hypothetical protein